LLIQQVIESIHVILGHLITGQQPVNNLLIIPKFFFVPDVIEKRKPLPAAQAKKNKNFFVFSS